MLNKKNVKVSYKVCYAKNYEIETILNENAQNGFMYKEVLWDKENFSLVILEKISLETAKEEKEEFKFLGEG